MGDIRVVFIRKAAMSPELHDIKPNSIKSRRNIIYDIYKKEKAETGHSVEDPFLIVAGLDSIFGYN